MFLLLVWATIFLVSAVVLGKAADYFVDTATIIGLFLGMSPIMIGIIILSLGTSIPELVVSILAALSGNTGIIIANVVGSNITNIVLVLGVAALISTKLKITYKNIHINFFVGATFLLFIVIQDGTFSLPEAIVFFAVAAFYMWGTHVEERQTREAKRIEKIVEEEHPEKNKKKRLKPSKRHIAIFIISPIAIFLGAQYMLLALEELASMLNVGSEVIAAVGVAFGTSLPELATTVSLARKGHSDAIIGNIMGSNIFNIVLVMSIPALLTQIDIPVHILTVEMPILIMVTLLYFFITIDKELSRPKGLLLFAFYVLFVAKALNLF